MCGGKDCCSAWRRREIGKAVGGGKCDCSKKGDTRSMVPTVHLQLCANRVPAS